MSETFNANIKFGIGGEVDHSYRYPHRYERQERDGRTRLVVGPREGHTGILSDLATELPPPLAVLYVLVSPGIEGHQAARYRSPQLTLSEVQGLLTDHRRFLECDSRHHLWMFNPDGHGLIVYNRHALLYACGPIESSEQVLSAPGFSQEPVEVPYPHWHLYHPTFHGEERRMLSRWGWVQSPLLETDSE